MALNKLKERNGFTNLELSIVDLCKFESVIAFVDKFEKDGGRLDILVANAAVAPTKLKITEDGWEESFQVNNLSTSLLSLLLLPCLIRTAEEHNTVSRMVIVTSEVHYWTTISERILGSANPLKMFGDKEHCNSSTRYSDTKLLNIFFARALAVRLSHQPLIVNTVNPGYCVSELRRNFNPIMAILDRVNERFLAFTAEEGSRQLVYGALSPSTTGAAGGAQEGEGGADTLRGAYINLSQVEEPSDFVLGKEGDTRQEILWKDLIEELIKVDSRVKDEVVARYLKDPEVVTSDLA